jgi:hypothetical protein
MTHPAVDAVLDFIKNNWSAGSYSDIPLERIDRDNSELLDGGVRSHSEDLQADNYVGATLADASREPLGTGYDHRVEVVVGVRVEGLHHTGYGNIDPDASLPPATAGDPVPWSELVDEIRTAILRDRTFPDTSRSDIGYKDLFITNDTPAASDYGDYYRRDFDVAFRGFEELP